jgi:phage-related protein (TIGR01555 family)
MPSPRRRIVTPPTPPLAANGAAAPAPNGHTIGHNGQANGHTKPGLKIGTDQYLLALDRAARKRARTASPYNAGTWDKLHPPAVGRDVPIRALATDSALTDTMSWAQADSVYNSFAEGVTFLGYAYLSTLAQRAEYRAIVETIAGEMTREWIEFKSTGDEDKSEKISQLRTACSERFKLRELFRKAAIDDGNFGRGHIYIDVDRAADGDHRDCLQTSIGNGRDAASTSKVSRGTPLTFRAVEPLWCYPQQYNTTNPLADDWYTPTTWVVMSQEVHRSRLLTFVGREVPDMLKPAYSFGGLALTQMVKPYVDNWLRTRNSVSDLVQAFSVLVLKTVMGAQLLEGGEELFARADFFNLLRQNNGLLLIDKESEDLQNVAAPLGGLDALQAQAQEHMASASHIPIIKLLGIQPAGLNASSEGEIRTFYDWIAAFQELLFREPLTTCVDFVQLHLWGEVDPEITYEFVDLWQLDEATKATVEQTKAATHQIYADLGAVQPEDIRTAVQADPDSPYHGLDLAPMPEPPSPEEMMAMGGDPNVPPGGPPDPGEPANANSPSPPRPAGPPQRTAPSYKTPPSPTEGASPSIRVGKPGKDAPRRAYRAVAQDAPQLPLFEDDGAAPTQNAGEGNSRHHVPGRDPGSRYDNNSAGTTPRGRTSDARADEASVNPTHAQGVSDANTRQDREDGGGDRRGSAASVRVAGPPRGAAADRLSGDPPTQVFGASDKAPAVPGRIAAEPYRGPASDAIEPNAGVLPVGAAPKRKRRIRAATPKPAKDAVPARDAAIKPRAARPKPAEDSGGAPTQATLLSGSHLLVQGQAADAALQRADWIKSTYGDKPPQPWMLADEMALPEALRDLTWVDEG